MSYEIGESPDERRDSSDVDAGLVAQPGDHEFDAGTFVPEPVPEVDGILPPACPSTTPSGYFQFLDDTCGAKIFPSDSRRQLRCPVVDSESHLTLPDGRTAVYRPSSEAPVINVDSLDGLIPNGVDVVVVLIKRIDGVPYYRYLSHGASSVPIQPWSTSKFLAAANAASTLRIQSNYEVGLTARESSSGVSLGDLVTSIHNYDNALFSSNSLGRYFHDIGGRERANDLIHDAWLGRGDDESFGGNYGALSPSLGYRFEEDNGAFVDVGPDLSPGPNNRLSLQTLAGALRRIVLHIDEPIDRLPGLQQADVETLLYGAADSERYGEWGGMSVDTAIYLQSAHDIDYIDRRSRGRWRIFSKLGLGTAGEFLNVGYACLPVLDSAEEPVPDWGREFLIAARHVGGAPSWAARDRELALVYNAIVARIVDGRL